MTPFYFGEGSRRLFGIYDAASGRENLDRAVVLCNPWGPEYIHAHRAVRQAAIMLAAAGFHALRFDYFGTGDSAGDMEHASLDIWDADIRAALREARDISGAGKVTLVGLRLGALLAARVAAASPGLVDRLVLWDPVLDGRSYLEELFQACHAQMLPYRELLPRPAHAGGGFEVLGYPITEAMARELRGLDLRAHAADLPPRTSALLSGGADGEAALRQVLVPPLAPAAIERIEGPPCWLEYWPPTTRSIPAALLNRLVQHSN